MIVLALNELNIDYIKYYINKGELTNFKSLFDNGIFLTKSEKDYSLLEPWIQWTTVQTGQMYDKHKIYRLGDIVGRNDLKQIFEDLEQQGLSIGTISAFNAENRLLNPKFFIPDPWTQTKSSGGFVIDKLSKTISKFVNSNASGKVNIYDIFWLIISIFIFVRIKKWKDLIRLLIKSSKPGVKAAILDFIFLEVFVTLQKKYKPDFSFLFFNGGAHIQHHYLFNSDAYTGNLKNPEWYCASDWDPLFMILKTYDKIIGDLLKTGERVVGLTGLHQSPTENQTYYWRPNKHTQLVSEMGINSEFSIVPRMSRDFLINFKSTHHTKIAEDILSSYVDSNSNSKIFNIDNRGKSLFVELTYSKDIDKNLIFYSKTTKIQIKNLKKKLSFVAIKNGKHNGTGYMFSNSKLNLDHEIRLDKVYSILKKLAIKDFKNKLSLNG